MGKRFTSFLMGTVAALLLAAPTQAQLVKPATRAEAAKLAAQTRYMKGQQQSRQAAEMKAQFPRMFNKMTLEQRHSMPMMVPGVRPIASTQAPSVRPSAQGRFLAPAAGTDLVANVAYAPGMTAGTDRYIGLIPTATPTNHEVLAQGNYTLYQGAAFQDGRFYGVSADFTYASWGWYWVDLYVFDGETWELEGTDDITDNLDLIADDVATAADGTIYGVFWNAEGNGLELGIVDYTTRSRTTIGTIENDYVALGITKAGQLYGVATDGNLYKIDKATAAETVVGPTGVTVMNDEGQYYYQGGEIDQKTDTFYWFGTDVNDGLSKLYTVNLETGAATVASNLGEYTIVGVSVPKPAAEDGAPAKVTDLAVQFEGGSLTGKVNFTAPSATYAGETLAGSLSYKVLVNGEEAAEGTAEAGAAVSADVTVAASGVQQFTVVTINAVGESPKAKLAQYVGFDTPVAPADVTLSIDKETNVASLSWTAPAAGVHDAFIGELTYNVYRLVGTEAPVLVAEKLAATQFSETVSVDGLASVAYAVEATNGEFTSAQATSNGVTVGKAIEVPYYADFTDAGVFSTFTVINANGDDKTWAQSAGNGAYYLYSGSEVADDWLVTAPIAVEKGKSYNVVAGIKCASANYPEAFEIKAGNAASPAALTQTVVPATTVTHTDVVDYEGSFVASEDGEYYVAIHAISEPDKWRLHAMYLSIEKGAEPTAPAAVADLKAEAGAEGALEATITFTAPAKSINGNALSENLTKVELLRDEEVVKTFEDVVPGSAVKFVDAEDLAIGNHTYQVLPYNADGLGLKSDVVTVYVGPDVPNHAENITLRDNQDFLVMSWDKVTTGANGGYVDPAKVDYLIWSTTVYNGSLYLDEKIDSVTNKTRVIIDYDTTEGEQGFAYWGVQPRNEAGAGATYVAAAIVGKPYELPMIESFPNKTMEHYFVYYYTTSDIRLYYSDDASDNDGGAVMFTCPSAGEHGTLSTGKLDLKKAVNPTLTFDVKSTNVANVLAVNAVNAEGDTIALTSNIALTEDYAAVKVNLREVKNSRYVRLLFDVDFNADNTQVYFDNIKVLDLYDNNLVVSVAAPASVKGGSKAVVNVTVENQGEKAAEGFTVNVLAGNDVIFTQKVDEPLASFDKVSFAAEYAPTIFTEPGVVVLKAEADYAADQFQADNVAEAKIEVTQSSAAQAENLTAEVEGETVKVSWSAPSSTTEEYTEDFDDTEVFPLWSLGGIDADNHYGALGEWTLYDGDGGAPYGWEGDGITYDNGGVPHAWQVFNPEAAGFDTETFHATSGSQILISICTDGPTDDWLISPELPGIAQTLSFNVNILTAQYGAETYEVLYSTTGKEIADFQLLEKKSTTNEEWERVSFNLPAGTKYFAIRHTSNDVFGLYIDDVTYTRGGGSIAQYNVYVDEELFDSTEGTSIDLAGLTTGSHKVSVTVVYTSGAESAPVSVEINDGVVTAIESKFVAGKAVDIYAIDGRLVRQQATSAEGLKPGLYIVEGMKVIKK